MRRMGSIGGAAACMCGIGTALFVQSANATTVLPVNIDFSTASQYDSNFREPSTNSAIVWKNDAGIGGAIKFYNAGFTPYGTAVFDTSATGGVSGNGGTGGSKANADLQNFTISARIRAGFLSSNDQTGLFLRLGSGAGDTGGYLALATFDSSVGMHLRLFKNSSPTSTGTLIFGNDSGDGAAYGGHSRALDGDITTNTFYTFVVKADGNVFSMKVLSADGSTTLSDYTFTDTSNFNLSAGQVGVRMLSSDSIASYMDDISIAAIPEPAGLGLLGLGTVSLLGRRRGRLAART